MELSMNHNVRAYTSKITFYGWIDEHTGKRNLLVRKLNFLLFYMGMFENLGKRRNKRKTKYVTTRPLVCPLPIGKINERTWVKLNNLAKIDLMEAAHIPRTLNREGIIATKDAKLNKQ